jgi:hypothetical protein
MVARLARLLLVAWCVVPPLVLAVLVVGGRVTVGDATDLVVWLALPWASVAILLAVLRVMTQQEVRRRGTSRR